MRRQIILYVVIALLLSALVSSELVKRTEDKLMIATTTSLYDTGLLDVLAETYRARYGTPLYFIALGSGQSLEHARRGDVDAVLVHAPELENRFLSENAGGLRKIIAYNFFIIVGPKSDPAAIGGLRPLQALQKIHQTSSSWVSRGDGSGTHLKEKSLWAAAGFETGQLIDESWYLESGSGMGATLRIANELGAYTLADVGTYLKYRAENLIDLEVFVNVGKELLNVYSVLVVNPKNHPHLNFEEAVRFVEFLVSDEGQTLIGEFGISNYGCSLFYPAARLLEENTDSQVAMWIRDYAFFDNSECPPTYRFGQEGLYP